MKKLRPTLPIPSRNNRIAIVGEYPTGEDMRKGAPFSGQQGYLLTELLTSARIVREECGLFLAQNSTPPKGNWVELCGKKAEADAAWRECGGTGSYPFPPIRAGKYLMPKHMPDILATRRALKEFAPNIIVCMGQLALFAVHGETKLDAVRGTIFQAEVDGKQFKTLATYSTSYLLKRFNDIPIVVVDLKKALRESAYPDIRRVKRTFVLEPDLDAVRNFLQRATVWQGEISCDIETARGQITTVGFGIETGTHCISIPFVDYRNGNYSYWATAEDEVRAWDLVRELLHLPNPKVFQNGLYDIQYLWKTVGMYPKGQLQDTMMLHHSMYSELPKSLGFLGSVYSDEVAWKQLRPRNLTEQKKDE